MGTDADLDTIVDIYRDFPELYLVEFPARPRHGGATAERSEASARRAYCNRFRRGELCFIASSEGKLAHINWAPPSMGRTGGVGTNPPSTSWGLHTRRRDPCAISGEWRACCRSRLYARRVEEEGLSRGLYASSSWRRGRW